MNAITSVQVLVHVPVIPIPLHITCNGMVAGQFSILARKADTFIPSRNHDGIGVNVSALRASKLHNIVHVQQIASNVAQHRGLVVRLRKCATAVLVHALLRPVQLKMLPAIMNLCASLNRSSSDFCF